MNRPNGCQSTTEVTWASGVKTPIQCRRDPMHTGEHEGRIDGHGMLLTWPSVDSPPFVIKFEGLGPLLPPSEPAWNAACVINVNEKPKEDPWVTSSSSSILDDITAAAEKMRTDYHRGPLPMTFEERRAYNRFGNMFARALGLQKMPFPIEDAGPHPKDSE